MTEQKDAYVSDAPIDDPDGDRFNRQPFAQRIADTIAARKDPSSIVIGIYGAWGQGKTTVLNFIAKALDAKEAVTCLRYNPWRFATEEQMLIGFFDDLAQSIDAPLRSIVEKFAQSIGRREALAGAVGGRAQAAVRAAAGMGNVSLERLRQRLEGALIEKKTRIVVLIDDIDRLDRSEIQAVFRLVKLTADFKNVAYVLAFDHDLVARALGERYGDGGAAAGAQFLQKIIQVPLDLPSPDRMSLLNYAVACINEAVATSGVRLTKEQDEEYTRVLLRGIECRLRTPRMCKRYANALAFALPILKEEVNPVDLMAVEALRTLYPELYKFIRSKKELIFTRTGLVGNADAKFKEALTSGVEQALVHLTQEEQDAAKALLRSLFPVIAHVLEGGHSHEGNADEWASQQRVTTPEYFDRYFSYAIPPDDIPDRLIQELIATAPDKSVDSLHIELKGLLERYPPHALIGTLRMYEQKIPKKAAVRLARAVARIGDGWPNPDQFLMPMGPFGQATIFAANMIQRTVELAQRVVHAKEVIHEAGSADFAHSFFWWVQPRKDDRGFDEAAAKRETRDLGEALAGRITREALRKKLVEHCPTNLRHLLWVWRTYGDKEECRSHVARLICNDISFATSFLSAFTRSAWAAGVKSRPVFERDDYDSVVESVDADVLRAALVATYGATLDQPRDEFDKFSDDDEWVAHQFCRMHEYARDNEPAAEPPPYDVEASPRDSGASPDCSGTSAEGSEPSTEGSGSSADGGDSSA